MSSQSILKSLISKLVSIWPQLPKPLKRKSDINPCCFYCARFVTSPIANLLKQPIEGQHFLSSRNEGSNMLDPLFTLPRIGNAQEKQRLKVFEEAGDDISLNLIHIEDRLCRCIRKRWIGLRDHRCRCLAYGNRWLSYRHMYLLYLHCSSGCWTAT